MTDVAKNLSDFYDRIDKRNMRPLWTVLSSIITPEPKSLAQPFLWAFCDIRDYMIEAGAMITAKEAERRVLVLENPGLRGGSRITTSLYAGVQLVLPGEIAPAHRHSQSALRFILQGNDAHTTVNGERTRMEVGDFIITPSNSWHDHGNHSNEPIFWLDGLDVPLVSALDASFLEHSSSDEQPLSRPEGDALARYGANLLPVNRVSRGLSSPILNYPYARTRDALDKMRRTEEFDPCHGLKMRYSNPETGDHAMPTIGAFVQLLPKGFTTSRYRATDATVFTVVEGSGRTSIGGQTFEWQPQDIFVAPSWRAVVHEADEDAVLFSFSDRPVQEKLGLFREERGNL